MAYRYGRFLLPAIPIIFSNLTQPLLSGGEHGAHGHGEELPGFLRRARHRLVANSLETKP
jgi:hypothetical protein